MSLYVNPLYSRNVNALFHTIAMSEGTENHPFTKNHGFDVIVTGEGGHREVFADYKEHPFEHRPPKRINSKAVPPLDSSASGRYQILIRFWRSYAKMLKLKDFMPPNQDAYVIQQLKERHALDLIENGKFDECIAALNGLWASFPGRAYIGQNQHSLDRIRTFYLTGGGIVT